MTSFGYRLNPRYVIKECSSCGTLYTRDCSCSKGSVEEKILVPKPPKNCAGCARYGHPVNGPYCQGCTLLREKLEEDLVTYFQNFQNTSESSDGSTNVVNAPREPFFPVVHPPPQETSIKISHDQENVINSVQTFLRKFNRYSFFKTPKVLLLAWDRVSEIKDAFENKQNKPEDIQELFRKLLDNLKNIHEELAEFINSPGWNRPAVYDDDDDDVDYTIAITPVLSTEEPDNSLSMEDEHLDTIPATESDEVIKSSVEDLVLIPSEFKGISATMCDVYLVNKPTPLEAKYHFEIVVNSNDDYSSSDDDSLDYENIDSGSTTTHSDLSLPEYDTFIFDLSIHQFPPSDRSDLTHEEFGDELAHIISPPEYDCFYFGNFPNPGELISNLNSGIRENLSSTTRVNLPMLADVAWGHDGDGGGDDRPPPGQIPTGCQGKNYWIFAREPENPTGEAGKPEDSIPAGKPGTLDWEKQIAFWLDPKNLAQAAQYAQNRAKSTVIRRQGSRSLAVLRDMQMESSATREYPSLIQTYFDTHTVDGIFLRDEEQLLYKEMLRLKDLGPNTSSGVTYTDDEIIAIVRQGKHRGHIPGVGRV
nr:hypothetical protein [Tanacetum cinerariifolium]